MAFQLNQSKMQLLIILMVFVSFLSGCSTPQANNSNEYPRNVVSEPIGRSNSFDSEVTVANLNLAMSKRHRVIDLYNTNRFQEAFQEIHTWTLTSDVWKKHLINSPGDLGIFLPLSIAYNDKVTYKNLLSISNNQANASTATIQAVAYSAWDDFSRWLNCIYSTQKNREKCSTFENYLKSKAPESIKLIGKNNLIN